MQLKATVITFLARSSSVTHLAYTDSYLCVPYRFIPQQRPFLLFIAALFTWNMRRADCPLAWNGSRTLLPQTRMGVP
jgi:hypothetical protein